MPSVFVTARSAVGSSVSESVASLPGVGSFVPTGGVAVAVLLRVPVAELLIVPLISSVAVSPVLRSTVVEIALPVPEASAQEPVPDATHVQLTPVMSDGTLSATVAAVTSDGPLLVTVTV